jgi:hypothetical protein
VGLGFRRLSVPIAVVSLIREIVRRIDMHDAEALAADVLRECRSVSEVRARVIECFERPLRDLWIEQGLDFEQRRPSTLPVPAGRVRGSSPPPPEPSESP